MQAQLRVVQKQANVQQVRLLSETVIGRSADCNLKIASTQVSRRHCRIVVNDLGVYVEDLCSANGTYLNGRRLLPNQLTLAPAGAQLIIGPATFAVEYRVAAASLPELGAIIPPVAPIPEVINPVETTSIPLADIQAARESLQDDVAEEQSPFATFTEAEPAPATVEAMTPTEPPKRLRSLFGLFQRSSKKTTSDSTPVPFLPADHDTLPPPDAAESEGEVAPPVVEDVADEEVTSAPSSAELGINVDVTPDDAEEATDADNPFRQFSQY